MSRPYNTAIDKWLDLNRWREDGGIALWSSPIYPKVWVDTNPGDAFIYPTLEKGPFYITNHEDPTWYDVVHESEPQVLEAWFSELYEIETSADSTYDDKMRAREAFNAVHKRW